MHKSRRNRCCNKQKGHLMEYIEKGYIELAAAIVKQAIEDYKTALKRNDEGAIKECERFFKGGWGEWLTVCNGERIIKMCREEVENERRKKA